ncbi:MlaD family protein [Pseudochryseolinea flava]|uniref:MCE family protein n=1 Tax=Pseudochryseolinea flava TaxID=2059302 RepID=A0A364Y6P2_9BACT|nr:MlaD family protein [Pseudochryseolinea flava]RAW01768.1 MCE family protein [Pseudochryseolinea flava]
MKTEDAKQNIKLGLFVLIGLVLFLLTVFFIGSENNVFSKTFTVHAIFKNVEGLKKGDNVWLSGVKIGTVHDVKIVSEGKVIVTLSLKDKQNEFIKTDATASIGSDGLVGNKIVVIRPGVAQNILQDEDTLGAFSPADTQELINIAKDVGENTRSLTNDLKTLSKRIVDGQGIVGELMKDGEIAQELRMAVDGFKATSLHTARASNELASMVYKLNHGDGLVNTLASDTTLPVVFDETLKNVKQVSLNSAKMSENLQALIAKMNSGDNALGLLLADSLFANRMMNTMENAQSASAKLDENMEALKHNFLFRGYFRKKAKQDKKKKEEAEQSALSKAE